MKKLLNLLRYVPKRFVPILALVAAAAVPAAIMAWGPSRPTFTVNNPASYVTFNSITDNPNVGDERNFVVIKDAANTSAGGWQDSATAVPGKEYLVRLYVHNNAATSLNLKATNTRVQVALPTNTAKQLDFTGYVSADNANPKEVYDDAGLTSNSDFNIAYVPGSAVLYNNATGQAGRALSDDIVQPQGALVGYDKNDGTWPGCFQYAGYVTLKIKVQGPQTNDFTMSKLVSKHGENKWVDNYAAQPGETVDYLVQYKNVGQTQQDNVVVKDTLPAGMNYVAGSTILGNSKNPSGVKTNDGVTTTGLNIGSYAPNGNAWVIFSAKVPANDDLKVCGANTLHNVAKVETDNGSKDDSADVTTNKTCKPQVKYTCDGLGLAQISRTQFGFTAKSTIENADFVKYIYIVKNAAGQQVDQLEGGQDQVVSYTQNTVGKYTVTAQLVVKVDGSEKTVTSDACKKEFEVKEESVKPVYSCQSLQLIQKVSRDTFTFKVTPHVIGNNVSVKEYSFDFGDGQTKVVSVGNETQTHTYAKPGDYTVKVSVSFTVDGKTVTGVTSESCMVKVTVDKVPPAECKPGIPVGDERCNPAEECKPGVPMNSPDCVEKPTAPTELPSTGPEAVVGGLFGTSALGLGVHAWWNSRRALRDAIKR